MVSTLNKKLQLVRDAFVTAMSVFLIAQGWGKWVHEPVWYVLIALSSIFIVLSAVNITLLMKNVRRRGFYFGNAIYQLFPSFIFAGLLPFIGIPLFILNVVILVTLRQKKHEMPTQTSQPAVP